MNIYVVFYSATGHIYRLAEAVAEGARSVDERSVKIFQTAELTPKEVLMKNGSLESRKSFAHIPVITASELAEADAVIFGTPTNLGMMAAQMRNLLDQTEPLWSKGALIGKVGSVFTSTATRHGGQESTLTSFHVTLLHLGMIIVGVPYCEYRLLSVDAISGGNTYGETSTAGPDGVCMPNENEIGIARFQGQHVAEITRFLLQGRALSTERQSD